MTYKLTQILQQLEDAGLPEPQSITLTSFGWSVGVGDSYFLIETANIIEIWDSGNTKALCFNSIPEAIEKLKEVLK